MPTYLRQLGHGGDVTDVFPHTIAILHAPAYRAENSGALHQDWPRIPLADSKELLLVSAELGKQIAAMLDTETPSRRQEDAGKVHFDVAHGSTFAHRPERQSKERPERAEGPALQFSLDSRA